MKTLKNLGLTAVFSAFSVIGLSAFQGCSDDEKDMKEPPKLTHENAVEYYVTTTREHDTLVITTKKDIYSKFKLISSTVTKDTLPDIGSEAVTTEDDNGNEVKKTVPKAYDIYFKSERK